MQQLTKDGTTIRAPASTADGSEIDLIKSDRMPSLNVGHVFENLTEAPLTHRVGQN